MLNDLDAPVAGTQNLRGTYVVIQNVENPNIAAPTRPAGHRLQLRAADQRLRRGQRLLPPDRSSSGASPTWASRSPPTSTGPPSRPSSTTGAWATTSTRTGRPTAPAAPATSATRWCDTTNVAQPLGRAVDPWVHWHEMGGHGTLGDHVGSGNFGFAHSAGDGLAAIQMDPESALRALPERFEYAPFNPVLTRRFDRTWLWGERERRPGLRQRGDPRHLPLPDLPVHRRRPPRPRSAAVRVARGDVPDPARHRCAHLRTNPGNWDPMTSTNVPGGARSAGASTCRDRPGTGSPRACPAAPTTR